MNFLIDLVLPYYKDSDSCIFVRSVVAFLTVHQTTPSQHCNGTQASIEYPEQFDNTRSCLPTSLGDREIWSRYIARSTAGSNLLICARFLCSSRVGFISDNSVKESRGTGNWTITGREMQRNPRRWRRWSERTLLKMVISSTEIDIGPVRGFELCVCSFAWLGLVEVQHGWLERGAGVWCDGIGPSDWLVDTVGNLPVMRESSFETENVAGKFSFQDVKIARLSSNNQVDSKRTKSIGCRVAAAILKNYKIFWSFFKCNPLCYFQILFASRRKNHSRKF